MCKINAMKKTVLTILSVLCILPLAAKKPSGPQKITVMSYNIRNAGANDGTNSWQYRCPATVYMLEEEKPDIFGVQEAFDHQVLFITENCRDYKAYGVGREDGRKKGEHMSIFYNTKRVSILKKGTFWLSETPDEPSDGWDAACRRTATWALFKEKKSGKKFYYVNTHLDHVGKEARREGLELIVDRIGDMNVEGYPVILTGDFNVTPDDPSLRGLNERMKCCRRHALTTDESPTFNAWGREARILDYIYYSGFRECPEFKVVNKRYAKIPFISDHFPIKATLIF